MSGSAQFFAVIICMAFWEEEFEKKEFNMGCELTIPLVFPESSRNRTSEIEKMKEYPTQTGCCIKKLTIFCNFVRDFTFVE